MARIKNEELTIPLLSEVTCPHCWEVFAPQDVLFISDHNNLLGDARLGEDAKLIQTLNEKGVPLSDLADELELLLEQFGARRREPAGS